ncbi:hypothetical protein DVV95_11780 [Clostridium botulinum]|uniref:bacteriophage abortive infection AbiH family protein n=1 Tax=Clostridium botulinum TaxID=1491 RepID=UPI00196738C3|nr:bacteriophage abortive infection AbiH family protein [Clostridium botulinum]MBN1062484.1 hypothetical protein [Clostridium botulinum]
MGKLFIIGNGFDLSHDLKTSYEDFHKYLKNKYPNVNCNNYLIPETIQMPDGDIVYDDDEVVAVILNIISEVEDGEKWSDLETSLGYLEFDSYLDYYPGDMDDDKETDIDEFENAYNNEDRAMQLAGAIKEITNYFSEWINTININNTLKKKEDFKRLLDSNCFFLNFNYTETLEIVYEVNNICHIHGKRGENLLFGHGNEEDYFNKYMKSHIGSEGPLTELDNILKKNTGKAIIDNQNFFNSLSNEINEIYSYGFSFSNVDEKYIKEICNKVSTNNITWYLNDFDKEQQREKYIDTIRKCGFKGKVNTYSIKN